jgi:Fe-S oxidoreductase/FAD/FMN-containing dehydrogenase
MQLESSLEKICERVSFDRTERVLHSHDIAAIPNMIQPLVGDTTPEAVVQPQSEQELIELVKWAGVHGIPLTPRGKASSGYGGVIPIKQGVVVDFYFMKDVLEVNAQDKTVVVQPGITWEQLDKQIQADGLTLRLYPTSYPSSTVGGWLAQGGAGIGSYQYGYFKDNVISARVVLPSGEVRNFSGEDLELIADAEGITGFITQVTLRVMPDEDLEVLSIACPTAQHMQDLLQALIAAELPIWSMMFINPRMAEMKNRAPLMEHYGHPTEERVLLPAAYVLTLAFRTHHAEHVRQALPGLLEGHQTEILSERIAQHEWENRFKIMVVKRLGPSLVPAEVIIPLSSLGDMMKEVERKVDQPVIKEAVLVRAREEVEPEVAILGFIPSDQRKFGYNFVFGLALTIMKIAEEHGGRPYSTGLYFSKRADQVLGKSHARQLRAFKSQVDPKGLFNPGKVIASGLMGTALELASTFEPLIRPLGNTVITQIGERPSEPIRGIPEDIAWYAYACSQCGYCIDECDQFYGRGWESQSPRGKWYWLREYMEGRADWDQQTVDTFLACTTCELCNLRCSAALPIESSWMTLRGQLIEEKKKMTLPPFEMMAAAVEAEGDIWAGYRKDRDAWFPEDLQEKHGPEHKAENVYFAGCTASYVEQDISTASVRLLDEAGVDFTYLGEKESCCATPMLVAGKWEIFAETMKKNIQAVKDTGADTVITSCPACDMMWRQVYPQWAEKLGIDYDLTTKHYSEIVSEKIQAGEFSFPENGQLPETVTWHDSCHIGRVSGVYEPPRELIKAIPKTNFVEMRHNREAAHCCGSVITLIKEPDVAADVGEIRLDEVVETGAQKVLSLCPCCEFQLRVTADKKEIPIEVDDLAHYAAGALGYELPDPRPEVRAQWAVFEAMIALLTPEGFAELMDSMWPELIDAMPYGMGSMMRTMGKIPGTLELMKPLFPVLFPRMLPLMMPKVMATMLARVQERVPMPDTMAEQMPDLMPRVMDNLMPHMIDDLVPLVTEPMIAYLHGNNGSMNRSTK